MGERKIMPSGLRMKTPAEGELCTKIKNQIEPVFSSSDGCVYNEEGIEDAVLKTHAMDHEVFKADFNFICEVCSYFDAHGNKEDKKWIEELVWNKLVPVYKTNNVEQELVEHLIAQVTDCAAWRIVD